MSFFAGFVQGVFEGKDWREARDDRARKRKMEDERFGWEREDREWTGEARSRQRSEWGRTDYERSRADSEFYRQQREREEEEASQRRINESLARTLGLTDDVAPANEGNQGMSVMDAVPQDTRAAPPPSSQGLTVRGALGELGQGTQGGNVGSRVMEDRLAQRSAANQAPQPEISGQDPRAPRNPNATTSFDESVQTRPQGAPPSIPQAAPVAPVAPRQRIDSTPPIVVDTPRGPVRQDVLPPEPQPANPTRQIAPETDMYDRNAGFSLNNLIARPAAASTMPDDGPGMTTGRPYTDAELPPGMEPLTDFQRRDRERSASGQLSSAGESSNQPNILQRGALSVAGAFDRLANPSGIDPESPEFRALQEQDPQAATQALAQSEAAQQRIASREQRIEALRQPQGGTTPAPAGAAQATPQQQGQRGASQRTDDTQFFIDDVPMSISGPRRLATGSVADVVAQVTGSPVVEGSVKAAGESIAKSAGMSAAQALTSSGDKKPPTKAEVLAVSQRAGKAFSREAIRAHERVLAQEGKLDQIPAWREFAQDENTRAAVEKLTEAMFYWDMNDEANALQSVVELYNMNGYYDDGLSILSEGTAFAYDAAGNITGLTATFRDEATGNVFQRNITGPGDKIMAIVLGSLSPEATFEAALEAVGGIAGAASPQNAQSPIPDISHSDWRGYLDQARKSIADERGLEIAAVPQAEVEARARQIIANLPDPRAIQRGGAQGDVPVWQ